MATDQPMTLDDHVGAVASARAEHDAAVADPSSTVETTGGVVIPKALVTGKLLDDARHEAMAHISGPGGLGEAYEAAQSEWEGSLNDEDRQREQQAALDLQNARQAVREAHGQQGHRVAGNAVRS